MSNQIKAYEEPTEIENDNPGCFGYIVISCIFIWIVGYPIAWYPIWLYMDFHPNNIAELVECVLVNTLVTLFWPIPAWIKVRAWLATFPL